MIRSTRNLSRMVKPPIRKKFNNSTKKWCVIDKDDFVIADYITKEYADVIEQSINLVGPAAALLKILIEQDNILDYKQGVNIKRKLMREITIDKINEFLCNDVGFTPEPQDYSQNLRDWAKNLLNVPEDSIELIEDAEDCIEE